MFEKVLIANRGEIALRIHRACREMGIRTVAVHSTVDANAMHVRLADESVCIGPPPAGDSYLNIPAILSAASITGADAIHPGLGFLAENADFAQIVAEHDLTFIGPSVEHIRLMGDKVAAKNAAKALGIPVVPGGQAVQTIEAARSEAKEVGYPILIKAAAGGGGRGMRVARDQAALDELFPMAQAEAQTFFGDGQGAVVHLGERDCSMQRKHQKLVEETPSPGLNDAERERIRDLAVKTMTKLGYKSAGTLEFLFENGEFFFIEMNTRLQVEHPISEMISRIDLVREQIRIAAGAALGYRQADIRLSGHSIECRINAEHPDTFAPSPGTVTRYHAPGGMGVRVDSALYQGYTVPAQYDSLVAKLIVHGTNRNECLMRLRRALEEFVIAGIETTIPLHQKLVVTEEFINGAYDIGWFERTYDRKTGAD